MHDYAQNVNSVIWNRKMIQRFIQLYKENPPLYDRSHPDYKSKSVRTEVYNYILQQMQLFLPNLQLKDIEEKQKAIISQFCEENSLVKAAKSTGNTYEPKLWCYNQLKFLRNHITGNERLVWEVSADEEDAHSENSDASVATEINSTLQYRWEQDDTKIFIKLLKNYKILYDPNHKDNNNSELKKRARNKLLREARKIDYNLNLKNICNKIRGMRMQYKLEVRRLKEAEKNNKTYTPKLWCYELLKDLYKDITEKQPEVSDNDENMKCDNSTHESEDNPNNEVIYIETVAYEDVQDIIEETEVNYNEEFSTKPIEDTTQSIEEVQNIVEYVNSFEDDTEDIQPAKKFCNGKMDCDDTAIDVREETYASVRQSNNANAKKNKQSMFNSEDVNYEWLKNIVVAELAEILPQYRNEFSKDLQNIIRKYIIKSKADKGRKPAENLSARVSAINNQTKNCAAQDINLDSPSNVSFNIRFI